MRLLDGFGSTAVSRSADSRCLVDGVARRCQEPAIESQGLGLFNLDRLMCCDLLFATVGGSGSSSLAVSSPRAMQSGSTLGGRPDRAGRMRVGQAATLGSGLLVPAGRRWPHGATWVGSRSHPGGAGLVAFLLARADLIASALIWRAASDRNYVSSGGGKKRTKATKKGRRSWPPCPSPPTRRRPIWHLSGRGGADTTEMIHDMMAAGHYA